MSASGGAGGASKRGRAWDLVEPSLVASRTKNPIRAIVDSLDIPKGRDLIPLSLGDPTVFGNLNSPACLRKAVADALEGGKHNGYCHSAGTPDARAAVAEASCLPNIAVTADDVVVANGASGALDLAIGAMCNEGDNFLVPQPGFSLYETLAVSKGVTVRHYRLDPDRGWEVDLEHLESLINNRTSAILLNNPSNPCGSVYSEAHLRDILAVAERHHVPIIADEIYGDLVFGDNKFHRLASLTDTVPILSVSGMAKIFMVPGWRIGWCVVYDRHGALSEVRKGLFKMSQLILGACHLVQSAVPVAMAPDAEAKADIATTFEANRAELERNASFTAEQLSKIAGLRTIVPAGAMYVMVGLEEGAFEGIEDDRDFAQKLLSEEAVFVLPGQCFGMKNFIRIVFCAPHARLATAFERMASFCDRYRKK